MGFRFRRSVRLLPGVRLNFTTSGLSATLGARGLSVGVGRQGTHLNLGLPGTGLSVRQRVAPASRERPLVEHDVSPPAAVAAPELLPPPAADPAPLPPGATALTSAAVEGLGSESMETLAQLIREAVGQQQDAHADLQETTRLLEKAERRLARAQRSLLRWLLRSRIPRLEQATREAREDHEEAQRRLDAAPVDVDFDLEVAHAERFEHVTASFEALTRAAVVWDATSRTSVDQRSTRSAASHGVTRQPVNLAIDSVPAIRSQFAALRFCNANGEDVRLLPAIVLIGQPGGALAVVDIRELSIAFRQLTWMEDEAVPSDARVVGETWDKVNKDGTPDRRFKDNRKHPLVAYGELTLTSPTGLQEVYVVSSADAAHRFSDAFDAYKHALPSV